MDRNETHMNFTDHLMSSHVGRLTQHISGQYLKAFEKSPENEIPDGRTV